MIERFYNYYKGYITLKVKTNQAERFLNIAVNNNIYIWNLIRISENEMTFNVSVKGFKKLRKIAYETKAKVKIIKKTGAFRLIRKIKSKKVILLGFLPGILFLIFLGSLILDIEITGNETVPDEVILQKLSEIDLQKFKLRSNIDSDKISVKLINDLDNIAWVGVTEQGTKLTIEIKERKMPPEMIPLDVPCHIIAKKDGIIHKMNVRNGEASVTLNQVVTKGQLLVSGIINTQFDGQRYVHSMADIIARTWWEKFLDVKLYEYEKNFTGNKQNKIFLKLFSKEFDLSFGSVIPYFNSEESVKRYVFGFLEVAVKTYEEYTLIKKPISEEEAVKRGKESLIKELQLEFTEEKIKSTDFQMTYVDDETLRLKIIANIEEDIGETLQIQKAD